MIDINEFNELQRIVKESQSEADRAAGAEEQLMQKLLKDFGCGNLEAAKKKLAVRKRNMEITEAKYKKALAVFQKTLKQRETE